MLWEKAFVLFTAGELPRWPFVLLTVERLERTGQTGLGMADLDRRQPSSHIVGWEEQQKLLPSCTRLLSASMPKTTSFATFALPQALLLPRSPYFPSCHPLLLFFFLAFVAVCDAVLQFSVVGLGHEGIPPS